MALNDATIDAWINDFVNAVGLLWTNAERVQIRTLLKSISDLTTPHIVDDVPISNGLKQAYQMNRVIERLEDALCLVASRTRRTLGLSVPRLNSEGDAAAIELRSATQAEIESIHGVGPLIAARIARFVSLNPVDANLEALDDVEGVGDALLAEIRANSYLGQPVSALLSASLVTFLENPSLSSLMRVFERTDLEYFFGDQGSIHSKISNAGQTEFERLFGFMDAILKLLTRQHIPANSALASEIKRWADRRNKRDTVLGLKGQADAQILTNADYAPVVETAINNSARSLNLMMFLATPAPGLNPGSVGPLQLVEALEAAARRGVNVRVILDQDDGGEPYLSYFINRPLFNRLSAAGIEVKFDERDTLLHSKLMILDDSLVAIGSHNWTRSSLNDIHELSLFIQSAPLATAYNRQFNDLWNRLPALP